MRGFSIFRLSTRLFVAVLAICSLPVSSNAIAADHRPDVIISVQTDKIAYQRSEDSLTAYVNIENTGSAIHGVDAHVLIAPASLEQVYEWPNWNTQLQPAFTSLTVPEGFTLDGGQLFSLQFTQDVPWVANAEGSELYYLGVVLTREGTTELVSNLALIPFFVTVGSEDTPRSVDMGLLGLTEIESFEDGMVDRTAFGAFLQDVQVLNLDPCGTSPSSSTLPRDTCRLEQCATGTFGFGTAFLDSSLNAGNALVAEAEGPGVSANLGNDSFVMPVDPEGRDMAGAYVYVNDDLTPNKYVEDAIYTFNGYGARNPYGDAGADIGPFRLSVRAPARLTGVQLNGNGQLGSEPTIVRNNSAGLIIRWNLGQHQVAHDDIWVRLSATELDPLTFQSTHYQLNCRFKDDGVHSIPRNLMQQLPATGGGLDLGDLGDFSDLGVDLGLSSAQINIGRANWLVAPTPGTEYTLGWIESGVQVPIVLE